MNLATKVLTIMKTLYFGNVFKHIRRDYKRKIQMLRISREGKKQLKLLGGGYIGSSKEYHDVVLRYWHKYKIKPDKFWYSLYCEGQNTYDPRYIPDTIWICYIRPYFNDMAMRRAYTDKGMLNRLLTDVKKPETIVKNVGGYYYDGDAEQLVSRQRAEEICSEEQHLIIKPSIDSYGGNGIVFFDRDNDNSMTIPMIFDKMNTNFVVQRIIKQHPDLNRINEDSISTVRVISFHFNGQVHILSSILRIGAVGSRVDNYTAGGSACAVYPTGWLHEKSLNKNALWSEYTANGIKLSTIRVPNYEEIIETVKRLHCELPYFNLIGWDFAVGEDGAPIMIEFNIRPGQNQIEEGAPTFGDLTEEVLDEVFIKKSWKHK